MSKILRIETYQKNACYKTPFAQKYVETRPLPDLSMVSGLIHNAIQGDSKEKKYYPLSIGVQGYYEGLIKDLQTFIQYKSDGKVNSAPYIVEQLVNVNLVIHIKAEEDIINKIKENLQKTVLSLGRTEDILKIKDIKEVELNLIKDEKSPSNNIYVPQQILDEIDFKYYVPMVLNGKYTIKKGIREFKRIKVGYAQKDNPPIFEAGECFEDNFGDIVFLFDLF